VRQRQRNARAPSFTCCLNVPVCVCAACCRPVINEWPKCAVLFEAGDLLAARRLLLDELQGYAAFRGAVPFTATSCQHDALCPAFPESVTPWVRPWHAGIKVCVVFDARSSLQKEAQREVVSEQLEIVFSAGGVCWDAPRGAASTR
jgi:hypothetical protein